jgi:hypothetical protein
MTRKPAGTDGQETAIIELTRGQFAIIDAEDCERISKHKWSAHKAGSGDYYAIRRRKKSDGPGPSTLLMHREILNVPAGMQTHHKNHITLDNRKCNIEIVTAFENNRAALKTRRPDASKFKGAGRHCEDYADGGERKDTRAASRRAKRAYAMRTEMALNDRQREELKEFIESLPPADKFLFDLFCWHRKKGNRPSEEEKFDIALKWDEIADVGRHIFTFTFDCK